MGIWEADSLICNLIYDTLQLWFQGIMQAKRKKKYKKNNEKVASQKDLSQQNWHKMF